MRRVVGKYLIAITLAFVMATTPVRAVNVSSDTTITTNVTATPGADGANHANGGPGSPAINWTGSGVDVVINANLTITGGAGGAGGADASNDGGNNGGPGGPALYLQMPNGTVVTNSGDFIYGGAGGAGSDGGVGGAADTTGGSGSNGGNGIYILGSGVQVNLVGTTVVGGRGGDSGDVGDTAAASVLSGTSGGPGGFGIEASNSASISLVNSSVTGGAGGNAGNTAAGGTNGNGGAGGAGILVNNSAVSVAITIDANSSVNGGTGGAPGSGGTGGSTGVAGRGIVSASAGTSILNSGLIQGRGGVLFNADATLVDNFGTIQGQNEAGVWVANNSTLTDLHNEAGGLIQGTNAVSVLAGSRIVNFTNDGTLTAVGTIDAIYVLGQVGVITNTGTINGNVRATSNFSGMGLSNSGTINGNVMFSGTGDHSFAFQSSGVMTGNLIGGAGGDYVSLLGGAVNGFIDLAGGTNQISVSGVFDTGDAIRATGGGLFLTVGATGIFNVGNLIDDVVDIDVSNGGRLHVSNALVAGSGALGNQGTVAIDGDAQLQVATMTAGGNFVFGLNASSESPRLVLSGGALDFTGTTLQVAVQLGNGPLPTNVNFLVAQGVGAATGVTNGQQIADDSALLNFFLYRGDALFDPTFANQVYLQTVAALLADIAGHGDDPNAVAVGGALDTIGLNGDNALDNLMLKLALQQTDAQINAILDSLLPETDGVAYDIATDAGDQIFDVASRRLDGLRGTSVAGLEYRVAGLGFAGMRGSAGPRGGVELWGQAFGRIVDQRRRAYNDGYDADGYGFAVGADTPFDGGASLIGAAFAYGQTSADGDGVNRTSTDVDSYQLVLYGDRLFENRAYAKGMLGYGWHANDVARHDVGGTPGPTLASSYDAWQITARAEAGRPYMVDRKLTLIPHLTANYAYYDAEAYSEAFAATGEVPLGGTLALDVAPESLESFRLGLGVLARWDVEVGADALLQPELRLNYRHEFIGDRFETTSEFVGAPGLASFRTLGVDPPRDILDVGVGALLSSAGGIDVRASYDLELKDSYTAHGGYLRASVSF